MADWEDVRRIALALPEASERVSRDLRQWRVRDKLFVWERPLRRSDLEALGDRAPKGPILGARVEHLGAKEALLADDPGVFFATPHFDGYPAVLVRLDRVTAQDLDEVVVEAWLARAPARVARAWLDARDGLTLELARVLPAPPPVVFEAFAERGELARWWGPEGFSVPSLRFRPRVGARYRIAMQPPEGSPFAVTGTFREVDPPAVLAFTFAWEPPDPDDAETLVRLAFRDRGHGTEVVLTQGPFRTEARRALHRDGWAESLDRLERLIRSRPAARGRRGPTRAR